MSSTVQRSFSSGEISPALYARADLVKYATGLRTCRNFAVARHGGVFNRPGSKFIAEVKDSSKRVRLIPFIFNADQTYVLEFGNLYMRAYRDSGQVLETTNTITNATQSSPCVVTTSGAHGYLDGDEVFIQDIEGMDEINNRNFIVTNKTPNTFELKTLDGLFIDSTPYAAYISGGEVGRVYTIPPPYSDTEVQTIQFAQSADVMTIVHNNHAPQELARTGHASWTITAASFVPAIATPTGLGATGTAGTNNHDYVVTAIAANTYEESLPSALATIAAAGPSATDPVALDWADTTGAVEYNIYRGLNGTYWYIGTSVDSAFSDTGYTQDFDTTPPISRNPFSGAGNYPATVGYYQQRRLFGNTLNSPETIWTSRAGLTNNFTISSPTQADDAITFNLAGREVNSVRHIIEANKLVALTSGGEWAINGDTSGALKPTDINAKAHAYNGSSEMSPLVVNGTVVYVQSRGTIVRDLGFDVYTDGYKGTDLTIYATHLFDDNTITDWAYQKTPHSIVWAVRDDGELLGMTYIKEHEVLAWHRHDFENGVAENVAVIPEGNQDALFVVIKRTINGATKRYIERILSRRETDIEDMVYMDSSLSYDGRNDSSETMKISGSGWTYDNTLTLNSITPFFYASDVGNEIHFTDNSGVILRFRINAYVNSTEVTGKVNRDVPTELQNNQTTNWSLAVDEVGGLWHLEGQNVSIIGDGLVVSSPNNSAYVTRTVVNGAVTLDRAYSVIHVGLPIVADLETLDIEFVNSETISDKKKIITKVSTFVESSRGIWVGPNMPNEDAVDMLEGLVEFKLADNEGYDDPLDLKTETIDVNIRSSWNSNGRVFVRQVDPLPLSILAIVPAGFFPVRG